MRVEIVPTLRHWEVAEVAPEIPIARGWWRQLDMEYNPLFYDGTLDAASYREWLHREAVSYVALPHSELDDAGVGEAALIAEGLPFLELDRVLTDWTVYEVVDPRAIVAGPGTLVEYGLEDLVIRVSEPGTLHVAVRPARTGSSPVPPAAWRRATTASSTSPASNPAFSVSRSTSSSPPSGTAAPTAVRVRVELSRLRSRRLGTRLVADSTDAGLRHVWSPTRPPD